MAVIVFSGGHTLKVPANADSIAQSLSNEMGVIYGGFETVQSGDSSALVNPRQIAYITDDEEIHRGRAGS